MSLYYRMIYSFLWSTSGNLYLRYNHFAFKDTRHMSSVQIRIKSNAWRNLQIRLYDLFKLYIIQHMNLYWQKNNHLICNVSDFSILIMHYIWSCIYIYIYICQPYHYHFNFIITTCHYHTLADASAYKLRDCILSLFPLVRWKQIKIYGIFNLQYYVVWMCLLQRIDSLFVIIYGQDKLTI